MKKFILSLSFLLTVGATAVFATEAPADLNAAKKTFQQEFKGAEHVAWNIEGDYSKVVFVLGGHRTVAWFSETGELVGSARDIFYNQLPLVVSRAVEKRFSGAAIIESTEVSNADGTRYKLTVEYNGRKYKIAILPDGGLTEIQKLKK